MIHHGNKRIKYEDETQNYCHSDDCVEEKKCRSLAAREREKERGGEEKQESEVGRERRKGKSVNANINVLKSVDTCLHVAISFQHGEPNWKKKF